MFEAGMPRRIGVSPALGHQISLTIMGQGSALHQVG
jgi:hypothetical protein